MFRPKKEKEKRVKLSKDSIKKAKKIFSYMRPYRGTFAIGWFFLVLSSVIGLGFPLLMGQLLGSESEAPSSLTKSLEDISIDSVNSIALALFIMFGIQAFAGFFRIILFTNVTEKTLRDVRADAFKRLVHMPMDFFNKNERG